MEGFKVICPMCYGMSKMLGYTDCDNCGNKGEVDPPQHILDDLECAEIERELLSKGYHVSINQFLYEGKLCPALIIHLGNKLGFSHHGEYGTTKLQALRKAKEWIEGRG